MNNSNNAYSKLGGWLMLIFIIVLLNALGDIYVLIWGLNFFGVYASRSLLLIFTPLTLVCSVLCLVFISIRKLNLFKISFCAACLIGLTGLIANLIAISPATFFADAIQPMAGLLNAIYMPMIIIGVIGAIGVPVACMFYFKRSKRVAAWFGSNHTIWYFHKCNIE